MRPPGSRGGSPRGGVPYIARLVPNRIHGSNHPAHAMEAWPEGRGGARRDKLARPRPTPSRVVDARGAAWSARSAEARATNRPERTKPAIGDSRAQPHEKARSARGHGRGPLPVLWLSRTSGCAGAAAHGPRTEGRHRPERRSRHKKAALPTRRTKQGHTKPRPTRTHYDWSKGRGDCGLAQGCCPAARIPPRGGSLS